MPSATDLAIGVLRWVEYVGLIYVIGVFVVRRLARNSPRIAWVQPSMHRGLALALVGGLGVVLGEAFAAGHSVSGAIGFLSGSPGGWLRIARVVLEAGALYTCLSGRPLVAPLTLFAAASLAFVGHAAQSDSPAGAMFADVLHVVSAGAWAGGILALATLRPPGGWRGEEGRMLLVRFGRVALIAFAITAMTGVLDATGELRDLSDLWTTSYGLVLSAKSVGVLAMLVLSVLAWRRGLALMRFEAGIALMVLGATALLAAYPLPPVGMSGAAGSALTLVQTP
ncbi:MAG TPA: CopD family protein [Candidatus Micrarchaeaceae archaeon]|nr:CopD family protein [Candidatus Micrarchaeaceae archaeon]